MSKKAKNIISVAVAAVAVAAVVAVVVLACITVKPMEYNGWLSGYENAEISVYYNGNLLSDATDEKGNLIGTNDNYKPEYSYKDIIESMNFSLFSACIQFNYDYKLRLSDKSDVEKNEVEVSWLAQQVSALTTGNAVTNKYTIVIKLPEEREMTLKADGGKEVKQTYDSAIFVLTEDSDWARMLEAYVYKEADLHRVNADELENTTYYSLRFGARTAAAIDMLDVVYGNVAE